MGGGGGAFGRGPPPVAPPNFRAKGSAHRVMVKGLPMSASWQDLKVHLCLATNQLTGLSVAGCHLLGSMIPFVVPVLLQLQIITLGCSLQRDCIFCCKACMNMKVGCG